MEHLARRPGMQFEQVTGWLIGGANHGISVMFVMMHLRVGLQGLGIAKTAYQNSMAYTRERLQVKFLDLPASRQHEAADPIAMHPAVQRLLMTQRVYVEGGRMLAYCAGLISNGAEPHPDQNVRDALHEQGSLIVPVVKAMPTEQGFQGASNALQVFGGHGFISETASSNTCAMSASR